LIKRYGLTVAIAKMVFDPFFACSYAKSALWG